MKMRIFSVLLSVCVMLNMISISALATEGSTALPPTVAGEKEVHVPSNPGAAPEGAPSPSTLRPQNGDPPGPSESGAGNPLLGTFAIRNRGSDPSGTDFDVSTRPPVYGDYLTLSTSETDPDLQYIWLVDGEAVGQRNHSLTDLLISKERVGKTISLEISYYNHEDKIVSAGVVKGRPLEMKAGVQAALNGEYVSTLEYGTPFMENTFIGAMIGGDDKQFPDTGVQWSPSSPALAPNAGTYTPTRVDVGMDQYYAVDFTPHQFTITPAKVNFALVLEQPKKGIGEPITVTVTAKHSGFDEYNGPGSGVMEVAEPILTIDREPKSLTKKSVSNEFGTFVYSGYWVATYTPTKAGTVIFEATYTDTTGNYKAPRYKTLRKKLDVLTGAITDETVTDSGDNSSEGDNDNFWLRVEDEIKTANKNDVIKADGRGYDQMPDSVMEALRQNPNVSLVITWNGGKTITIPAGKAQKPEAGRVYYPLSLLEKLYKGTELVAGGPINPETGGPGGMAFAASQAAPIAITAPEAQPAAPILGERTIAPSLQNREAEASAGAGTPQAGTAGGNGLWAAAFMALLAAATGGLVLLWKKKFRP